MVRGRVERWRMDIATEYYCRERLSVAKIATITGVPRSVLYRELEGVRRTATMHRVLPHVL